MVISFEFDLMGIHKEKDSVYIFYICSDHTMLKNIIFHFCLSHFFTVIFSLSKSNPVSPFVSL